MSIVSVCKNVELEGIPRTGMLLPYMLNLKIRSSTFEINLNLRKKHYYIATLNTPIVYEYYNSNEEVVVEHTNVSKVCEKKNHKRKFFRYYSSISDIRNSFSGLLFGFKKKCCDGWSLRQRFESGIYKYQVI